MRFLNPPKAGLLNKRNTKTLNRIGMTTSDFLMPNFQFLIHSVPQARAEFIEWVFRVVGQVFLLISDGFH